MAAAVAYAAAVAAVADLLWECRFDRLYRRPFLGSPSNLFLPDLNLVFFFSLPNLLPVERL